MNRVLFLEGAQGESAVKRFFSGFSDVNMIQTYCDVAVAEGTNLPVYDAIVALGSMGGKSMGSYLIRKAVAGNVPVLGIAAGASVVREACDGITLIEQDYLR